MDGNPLRAFFSIMMKGERKSKGKIVGEEMTNVKVQIKQRQCQNPNFKEFRSFSICLLIIGREFEIWHSFGIWALTF
jgi:hypothetical protein